MNAAQPSHAGPSVLTPGRWRLAFVAASLVIAMHALWAAWLSGSPLPPIVVPRQANGDAVLGEVSLRLGPEMSPVLVELHTRLVGGGAPRCEFELIAPDGRTVAQRDTGAPERDPDSGRSGFDQRRLEEERVTRLARFEVTKAGPHRLRVSVTPGEWQELRTVEIRAQRNAAESHFFRNLAALVLIYVAIGQWRKGRTSPTPSTPAEPRQPPSPALPPEERRRRRIQLEGLALLISVVRLPLIGSYTALLIIALIVGFGFGDGGSRWEAAKGVLESLAGYERYLAWVLPQGEYHGWEVAWVLGAIGGTITFAIYLFTLPFRLLLPPRPPPTFRQRAGRMFYWHVALVVACGFWWAGQPGLTGETYEEMLIVFSVLNAMLYGPALLLATVTGWIERSIGQLAAPSRGGWRQN
jgi:hypothetical protein